jgi:hypothetical protein
MLGVEVNAEKSLKPSSRRTGRQELQRRSRATRQRGPNSVLRIVTFRKGVFKKNDIFRLARASVHDGAQMPARRVGKNREAQGLTVWAERKNFGIFSSRDAKKTGVRESGC